MIHPKDYFDSDAHNLSSLFIDGNRIFIIPDYQRTFAWANAELNLLWEDFLKVTVQSFTQDFQVHHDPKPHFFGAIVITETVAGEYEVIDGQQRLTASSILLKVMQEFAMWISSYDKQAGIKSIISPILQRNIYGQPFEQRLHLDENINGFYKEYILLKYNPTERDLYRQVHYIRPGSASDLIRNAHDFFTQKMEAEFPASLTQEQLHNKLYCYVIAFTKYFMFLKIVSKKKETAYTIFETLNKRGKDLSESDMIKNEIFKSVDIAERDRIKAIWDNITENIETENLTEFIRFQYASDIGPVRPTELFEVVKKHINTNNAFDYLRKLEIESEWYARITLTGAPFWNPIITEKLKAFTDIDVSHSIPLLLTGALLCNHNENQFFKLVNATLVFCFRYFTVGGNSVADLEKEIGYMSRALRNPKDIMTLPLNAHPAEKIQNLDELISYMKTLTEDAVFERKLKEFRTKSNQLAFYILYNLEKSINPAVMPSPQSPSQHLEHIMPRTPSTAAARAHEWAHVKNDPNYKEFLFRIGNMIILESDINQRVRNKDFSVKKSNYKLSGLVYPKQIADTYATWDFNTIDQRQTQIAQRALSVWKYI
jgi:hypothetical protein